mgnify:CR=1 FL=1
MASGREYESADPLTAWGQAAENILRAVVPVDVVESSDIRARMLALVTALDQGDLDPALADAHFRKLTEDLLLAILQGEKIEVTDPGIYAARNEIFAAAQVIYNQAVARGIWKLHPEIRTAIEADE